MLKYLVTEEPGLTNLWRQYIEQIRSGKITPIAGDTFGFAKLVAKAQHDRDVENSSMMAEAWDELYQWTIETVDQETGELMNKILSAVKKRRADDLRARNNGVNPDEATKKSLVGEKTLENPR